MALQVTVAPEGAPVASTKAMAVVRDAPVALFQLILGRTPALSAVPIDVPPPTKLMPTAMPGLGAGTGSTGVVMSI